MWVCDEEMGVIVGVVPVGVVPHEVESFAESERGGEMVAYFFLVLQGEVRDDAECAVVISRVIGEVADDVDVVF